MVEKPAPEITGKSRLRCAESRLHWLARLPFRARVMKWEHRLQQNCLHSMFLRGIKSISSTETMGILA